VETLGSGRIRDGITLEVDGTPATDSVPNSEESDVASEMQGALVFPVVDRPLVALSAPIVVPAPTTLESRMRKMGVARPVVP